MKMGKYFRSWLMFTLGIVPVQAAWWPVGPPPWTNTMFQTVGGITYFTHISWLQSCHRVTSGSVARSGPNLSQVISEEAFSGICGFCFDCYHAETHVSILGALPPGDYRFTVYSAYFGEETSVFGVATFNVPATTPTLTSSVEADQFRLSVEGVPNVTYVIETSSTLTNWSSVAPIQGLLSFGAGLSQR